MTVQSILGTIVTMKSSRKSARHAPTKYKTGQEIVYPLQGVGHIQSIEERPFRDKKLLYYIIYLEVSDMTVMVPCCWDRCSESAMAGRIARRSC